MTRLRASLVLSAVLGILVFYRLRFGIDFTDEAYYAAMAVRFLRGDIPFRDELFVNQTGVLIVLPFIRPYFERFGTEGIVYFLRILYFLFSLALAVGAYASLSLAGRRVNAVAAALVAVVFIPLNIPALSYNTLGGGGFALALFFTAAYRQTGGRLYWLAAMLSLGLAEFAYPPLGLAGIFLIALSLERPNRKFVLLTAIGAHAAVALTFLPYFLRVGPSLTQSFLYTWTAHQNGGGLAKLWYVAQFIVGNTLSPLILAAFGVLALSRYLRGTGAALALVAFPVLLFVGYREWIFPSIWFFTYFTLAAPVFYHLGPRTSAHRTQLRFIWLPSLLAGLITAWVSTGSPANAILGFWGGGILSAYFFMEALESLLAGSSRRWQKGLSVTGPAVVLGGLGLFLFAGKVFYCDGAYPRLTSEITAGPFRGLWTTVEKHRYLKEITDDVQRLENPEGRIVFYEFPAGYLLTDMRAGVNSAWMRTVSRGKQFYTDYYREHSGPHDLVFAVHRIDHGYPSPIQYSSDDPFVAYVRESHHLLTQRDNYQIFAPNPPKTASGSARAAEK